MGRASPSGLGSPSLPGSSALSPGLALHRESPGPAWGRRQPANFRRACAAVGVLGGPGRIPSGLRAGARRHGDVARRPGAGQQPALEPRGGRSEAGLSSGFDRCQERKRFPLAITGHGQPRELRFAGRKKRKVEINADLVGRVSATPRVARAGCGARAGAGRRAQGKEGLPWTLASVVKFVLAGGRPG